MIMLDLVVKKRFLTKFNKAKQVLLLKSTTQIWILLLRKRSPTSSVESISNATILCVQRYIVLYPKFTMPASRTASFQQHENRKRKHLKASRGRKQGNHKSPKRAKCSLTSEKAKKSILLWIPYCCCCCGSCCRRRHKQSATVFYDEQLLSTECTQENAWKAGRRSKWQQTKNQESRYSSRQRTCCSLGIFSITENQRGKKKKKKKKQKPFFKKTKKPLEQARLRLLLLPAAHSASYLLQNLHKTNFLQST